jgi:hypothetical protein
MFRYGSEGWIHYDYEVVNSRARFNVSLKPTQLANDDINFLTAADMVAEELADTHKNLCVAMSGGIDSEFVATTLFNKGIKFKPVIFMAEDLNELDVWWAMEWCKKYNVEPTLIIYSIHKFTNQLTTNADTYGHRLFPGTMAIDVISKHAESLGAKCITGSGNYTHYPDLVLSQMKKDGSTVYEYTDVKLDKTGYYAHLPEIISHQMNPSHPFSFFNWNPQIMYSYIKEYDINYDSAVNKARIMGCDRRPKNVGYPEYFWRHEQMLRTFFTKFKLNKEPHSEVDYLGTRTEMLNLLRTGDKNG